MKFAHLADCHIGSWRDAKMSKLSIDSFSKAMDICIDRKMDFILIAGDLFNTSLPNVDYIKEVAAKLRKVSMNNIPVYVIAGSHDFSPSGKTMLDVLEKAGLIINVFKGKIDEDILRLEYVTDPKTGVQIAGIIGKKGMLDKKYYEKLDKSNLESDLGDVKFKIFMLHTALEELKPEGLERMEAAPLSFLPKGFDYYAAGHVHYILEKDVPDLGKVVYPGALFPANFAELEKYKGGGFYIYDDSNPDPKLKYEALQIMNVHSIDMDCTDRLPEQIYDKLITEVKKKEFFNTIVTIRLHGKLKSGKPSDINFKDIFSNLNAKGAYYVMKSTTKLTSPEFEDIKVQEDSSEKVEESLIEQQMKDLKLENYDEETVKKLVVDLMNVLSQEKGEMTVSTHADKIVKDANTVLRL